MTALKTQSTNSDTPYYSQHDQAVIERFKQFGGVQGLGDEIYYPDEELSGMLQDFGLNPPGTPDKE